jgi:hypothetical protein
MELVPVRGMFGTSCVLAVASLLARPRPMPPPPPAPVVVDVPTDDSWRPRCEAMLDAARHDAELSLGVRFERLVHPDRAADPDELVFPSANGIELAIELAPNHGQAGADLFLLPDDAPRTGWLAQAYQEHGLVIDERELGTGPGFIRLSITARPDGDRDWIFIRTQLAARLEAAGTACLRP